VFEREFLPAAAIHPTCWPPPYILTLSALRFTSLKSGGVQPAARADFFFFVNLILLADKYQIRAPNPRARQVKARLLERLPERQVTIGERRQTDVRFWFILADAKPRERRAPYQLPGGGKGSLHVETAI